MKYTLLTLILLTGCTTIDNQDEQRPHRQGRNFVQTNPHCEGAMIFICGMQIKHNY